MLSYPDNLHYSHCVLIHITKSYLSLEKNRTDTAGGQHAYFMTIFVKCTVLFKVSEGHTNWVHVHDARWPDLGR